MNKNIFLLCIIATIITSAECNDVLGCGGFIKSHVPIDFSKVEVKLFTKNGVLKETTGFSPNNGYYFVPVYDKGEYTLELVPPIGWSFTPMKLALQINGVNDPCTLGKDQNFVFKGFGITGRVQSQKQVAKGPEGISVFLKAGENTKVATTDKEGIFYFTPVIPGKYEISISHPKWKMSKQSLEVTVTEGNTELPLDSFVIRGFDVTGKVKSQNEPIKQLPVMLFTEKEGKFVEIDGCNKSPIPGVKEKPLCHVKSNDNGIFVFDSVPNGNYYVKPVFHKNIIFKPEIISFAVQDNSVELKEEFDVIGFTINGYVLNKENGKGVPYAKVYLNDVHHATTDNNGLYKLDKLKSVTYRAKVVADGYLFKETNLKMNPNAESLPPLLPYSFRVCGTVKNDRPQIVLLKNLETLQIIQTSTEAGTGRFCEFLENGKYDIQVIVSDDLETDGLQFFPTKQSITVNGNRIDDIMFSKLKATLHGKIKCIDPKLCVNFKLTLHPLNDESDSIEVTLKDTSYVIDNVQPGPYIIKMKDNKFCWENNKLEFSVNNQIVNVPPFVQKGFAINISSSHDTKLLFKHEKSTTSTELDAVAGTTQLCADKVGIYTFEIKGCHIFEKTIYRFSTVELTNDIILNAVKHKNSLVIASMENLGNISISSKISGKSKIETVQYKNGRYTVDVDLAPNEGAVIVPKSDTVYFNPPILSITGKDDCSHFGVKCNAMRGKVFKGKVVPPLEGVIITLEQIGGDRLTSITENDGFYQFPIMDGTKNFVITAKKESYVMIGPDKDGNFKAHKLAEVNVEVIDENSNLPLMGALISLSGGESYRSNLQTDSLGQITFHSLSPSDYFLRPMMKEYKFEPSSKIITVLEGKTVTVKLTGKRVAYSAFGKVTTLNGDPVDTSVIAKGTGNCSQYSEESVSEYHGNFRIRGLVPFCTYEVRLLNMDNENTQNMDKSIPSSVVIKTEKSDVQGVNLVLISPRTNGDIMVKVYAKNPEQYKTFSVKLNRESAPTGLLHSIKVDTSGFQLTQKNNPGVLIHLPSLPLDNKMYSVQLDTTIPNPKWTPKTINFSSNSTFQYFELDFIPQTTSQEAQIKTVSVWSILGFLFSIGFLYTVWVTPFFQPIRDLVLQHFRNLNANLNTMAQTSKKTPDTLDNADIDQIVQSINNLKRKPKVKKL